MWKGGVHFDNNTAGKRKNKQKASLVFNDYVLTFAAHKRVVLASDSCSEE